MFIISDDILERLLCSQCKKYTSVKPIKVYPNRGIKCGRCSAQDDAGVVSLFDMVAGEGLFRCVNRYEGCNKLLTYLEVVEHEKTCTGGYYDCPLCVDFHGSAYEILQHYKSDHSEKFLEAAEFFVELENESFEVYLYKKNDFLFFVNVKFSISEDELTIMIEYVGPKENAKKINHVMSIHCLEGPIIKKSKKKICSAVAEQDPKVFRFNLKLDDFPKKLAICRFTLDTEAVENLVAVPENNSKYKFGKRDIVKTVCNQPLTFGTTAPPVTTSLQSVLSNSTNFGFGNANLTSSSGTSTTASSSSTKGFSFATSITNSPSAVQPPKLIFPSATNPLYITQPVLGGAKLSTPVGANITGQSSSNYQAFGSSGNTTRVFRPVVKSSTVIFGTPVANSSTSIFGTPANASVSDTSQSNNWWAAEHSNK